MKFLSYYKDIQGIGLNVAHVYEHAFINAYYNYLVTMGYSYPPLILEMRGATDSSIGLLRISVNITDKSLLKITKNFIENPIIPDLGYEKALSQVLAEETSEIINDVDFIKSKSIIELNKRNFKPFDEIPIKNWGLNNHINLKEEINFKIDKINFKTYSVAIWLDNPSLIQSAVFSRLANFIGSIYFWNINNIANVYLLEANNADVNDGFIGFMSYYISSIDMDRKLFKLAFKNTKNDIVNESCIKLIKKQLTDWQKVEYFDALIYENIQDTGYSINIAELTKLIKKGFMLDLVKEMKISVTSKRIV